FAPGVEADQFVFRVVDQLAQPGHPDRARPPYDHAFSGHGLLSLRTGRQQTVHSPVSGATFLLAAGMSNPVGCGSRKIGGAKKARRIAPPGPSVHVSDLLPGVVARAGLSMRSQASRPKAAAPA